MSVTALVSLLATAIAFLGACIAWGQWQTARQKLVLDLFDRRFEKYQTFLAACAEIGVAGVESYERIFAVDKAAYELRFLFSEEVIAAFRRISDAAFEWHSAERRFVSATRPNSPNAQDVDLLMDRAASAQKAFSQLQRELDPLIAPYLRMDQKLPRSPRQWLADAWRDRPDGTS